jgi:hypothetical protein
MSVSGAVIDMWPAWLNVLIVLNGLACWLGHLGHSFGRAAVGLGLEIQGDDVAGSGLAGGLEGEISSSGMLSSCQSRKSVTQ